MSETEIETKTILMKLKVKLKLTGWLIQDPIVIIKKRLQKIGNLGTFFDTYVCYY